MPASSNFNRIGVIREVTPGTIPANPAFQVVRITNDGLTAKPKTVVSKEKRSDGNRVDVAVVGKEIAGTLDAEMSYASHDLFIEEVQRATFVKSYEVNGITSVAAGTGVYTVPDQGSTIPVGSYVKITGCTNAANNGFFPVTAATATSITTGNAASVAEAAPPAASRLKAVGFQAVAAGNISATAGATNTISVTGTNPTTIGLVPGMWFQALNFATAANNGWYRVKSIAGAGPYTITCDKVPTGFATDTAAGVKVVLAFTDYVRNGTSYLTHTTERAQLDLAQPIYDYRKGDRTDSLAWDLTTQAIMGVKLSFLAMDHVPWSTTQVAGATAVAASTSPVMNTSSNVGAVAEALSELVGGTQNVPLGGKVTLKSNLRARAALGTAALAGTGAGTLDATGEINLYLDTPSILAKVMANTASAFYTRMQDANGSGYVLDMPTIKYTDGDAPTGAENTDVTPKLMFQALVTTPASGTPYAVHIQKFESVS